MKPSKPSLQEKIARLRASFVAQLPARLDEMQSHLTLLKADPVMNRVAAIELQRIFHSLKGTGHSFGFSELAEIAEEAETVAQQLTDSEDYLPANWSEQLTALQRRLLSQAQILAYADWSDQGQTPAPFFEMTDQVLMGSGQSRNLVYVCDDEPDQVGHLSYQLQCFGYQVCRFTDTATFHEAVLQQRPDAVIMDVHFPHGATAGMDTLAELKLITGQALPAIVLSGRNDFQARLSAVKAGCRAYFTKPARPLELVAALDEIMGRRVHEPYRVVIVDDEANVAQYHALILEEAGMSVCHLQHPNRVIEVLEDFNPDLVLVDVYMPECTGEELAALIRQYPEHVGLPIVYLSGETNRQKQFSAMQVGVEGFITKPVVPEELVAAVALRAERMRALRSLMARDSLTGLYNHTTTTEMIDNAVAQARRQQENLSLAMIDLDHFKSVNDTHGHLVGDQVLLALSRMLKHRFRTTDIIGRYGGEEFVVLLKGLSPVEAKKLVDELRANFAEVRFNAGEQAFHCTFSAGISGLPPHVRTEDLRMAADRALYVAKGAGRNCVKVDGANDEQ